MIAVPAIVAQQHGASAAVRDHNVQVAVVIEIAHRGAAPHVLDAKCRTALRRNIAKPAAARVLVEQIGLFVGEFGIV